jgi:hypothetical protein
MIPPARIQNEPVSLRSFGGEHRGLVNQSHSFLVIAVLPSANIAS